MQLYVSLTTLPSRIAYVQSTLDSLLAQEKQPDRIYLCLPLYSLREACEYYLPDWLDGYAERVEVVRCTRDDGPGTKLLGCLDQISRPTCLVIVDDDMRYKPYF